MKFLASTFLIILYSCGSSDSYRNWQEIKESKTLNILTVNSSTTYFQGKEGDIQGFEFDLISRFADEHGLKTNFIIKDSIQDVLTSLSRGEADIAASGLSITDKRLHTFSFTPSYFESYQVVTCKNKKRVKEPLNLLGLKIIIPKDTSFTENLELLQKSLPALEWREVEDSTSEVLLQEVWANEKICTIADEHILNLHRRYMPELKSVYRFKRKEFISWALIRKNKVLLKKLNQWFSQDDTQEKIEDLKRQYFDFIDFDPFNLKTFIMRIKKRLPKYKETFVKASKETNIPWELLAAVGYQESYWNPNAKSPTGVRGLMMLTRRTAKEMGVKDRTDPTQSIMGGARYLKKLLKRLPDYLDESDRIWFALASYNVGYYHLRDALALAIWQNKNPTKWYDVSQVLPLLSHKKHYKRLPYGHARGLEPVIYVKRIKDFYDILLKQSLENKK